VYDPPGRMLPVTPPTRYAALVYLPGERGLVAPQFSQLIPYSPWFQTCPNGHVQKHAT
jgi:hypothetical protein